MKTVKCKKCGGAYRYKVPVSSRESRYAIICPYCKNPIYKVVENGLFLDETKASPYFRNLIPKEIKGETWIDLSKLNIHNEE